MDTHSPRPIIIDLEAITQVLSERYHETVDRSIDYLFDLFYKIINSPLAYYLGALEARRLGNLDTFERMDFEIEERNKNYEI